MALIIMVCITAVTAVGNSVSAKFAEVDAVLQ
jgi:Flp pilus assembly pilin Flp